MLQLLNKLFFRLDRRLDVYEVKYNILRNNIYGCDISQIAVHITRLRMFLSLVIDQELDDKKSNKGIAPLPNLDFKFVCANTLISLPDGSKMQGGLFDSIDKNKLKELRDDYFATASKNKKIKLREKYLEEIKPKLGSSQFDDMIGTYKPFDNSNVASFYDPSLMHGVDGFDIVIGNPPYVGEKGNKETFQPIAKSPLGVRFYNGKMDLFYFFFHIALDLLKVNGVMAYITTNYYITATGAKKLKIDMRDRSSILNLINFGELKIFDSALGQHNLITILQKGNIDKKAKTVNVNRKGKADAELLNNITSGVDSDSDYYELNQNQLFSGENIKLTNGGLDDVLDKIKNKSQSLDSICDVNQGLRTGADKVTQKHINDTKLNLKNGDGIFIINSNEKENIKLDSVELDYIKPLYKNSDIYKWGTNLTTKYNLIDLFFPNNKNINIKTIPNIMNHLSKYKKILEHRKENANGINKQIEKGNYYFASVRRKLDFDQEKIVAPQRSKTNTFGYNNVP
ncbi:MAG: Eco57I restriction-modification methylase domain-containing protein [Cyanobium sp. MAG06]|nr:Eco57I restriction-modification methylase domain-containing protein [Cyanobium sp. MAG06]